MPGTGARWARTAWQPRPSAVPCTYHRLNPQTSEVCSLASEPHGVGVVIVAEHACMSHRGARARGARTVTSALYGGLRDNPALRGEFRALTRTARERS